MLALALTGLLLLQVLGSKDYSLEVLDPRTINLEKQEVKQSKSSNDKLTFTLSSFLVDFGALKPTVPVLRETTIKASSSGTLFYSLLAFEDHPLRQSFSEASPLRSTQDGQDIPDTTCDNGTCRETLASEWLNPLAYGFGWSFGDKNYWQFANAQAGETKQTLINTHNEQELKIIYKLNISKTQPAGVYTNTITYILVPNF